MQRKNLSTLIFALSLLPFGYATASPGTCSVNLTQEPLVMRVGKDEFRIAFGLDAAECRESGCAGAIRYDATWQSDDGRHTTERKTVAFDIPAGAVRSLSVDRHYFDTAEAQHTTQLVNVAVERITCAPASAGSLASR